MNYLNSLKNMAGEEYIKRVKEILSSKSKDDVTKMLEIINTIPFFIRAVMIAKVDEVVDRRLDELIEDFEEVK